MLRFTLKDIDESNALYIAEIVSNGRVLNKVGHGNYMSASETPDAAIWFAVNSILETVTEDQSSLHAVRVLRVSGRGKTVSPKELHINHPHLDSIYLGLWYVDINFSLVPHAECVYLIEVCHTDGQQEIELRDVSTLVKEE